MTQSRTPRSPTQQTPDQPSPDQPSPIRPTDADARALARNLLREARSAALATLTEAGHPMQSRIAFGLEDAGQPISLVSTLAAHTQALRHRPQLSLLLGEPGDKGDPLVHPRLTLNGTGEILPNTDAAHQDLARQYLRSHPKAKLYIGFADFHFLRFHISDGFLNGGFGQAYRMTPSDLFADD